MLRSKSLLFSTAVFCVCQAFAYGQNAQPARPLTTVIDNAMAAHGSRVTSGPVLNSKAAGTLTYFTYSGEQVTFNVLLVRKGRFQVQRTIQQPGHDLRQGSNGVESWNSVAGFTSTAESGVRDFIESQTTRSIQSLFDYRTSGLSLRDLGNKAGAKVIETEDVTGKRTRYSIDDATSLVARLEIVIGETKDPFGRPAPMVDAYVFGDYRNIEGVLTPFKIERYRSGMKVEEMRFTSVTYNTNVTDLDFRPQP